MKLISRQVELEEDAPRRVHQFWGPGSVACYSLPLNVLTASAVLTDDEIAAIEEAGAKGPRGLTPCVLAKRASLVLLSGIVGFGLCSYMGVSMV